MELVILTDYFRSPTITQNRQSHYLRALIRLCSSDSHDQSNRAHVLHLKCIPKYLFICKLLYARDDAFFLFFSVCFFLLSWWASESIYVLALC